LRSIRSNQNHETEPTITMSIEQDVSGLWAWVVGVAMEVAWLIEVVLNMDEVEVVNTSAVAPSFVKYL
jgi:hypothetical protein